MGHIVVRTLIRATPERCFDLARDVGVHCQTSAFTGERVVPPGRMAGLLELGDSITFEGRHFGLRWRLTASIVQMQRPRRFVDRARGRTFLWLEHVHEFVAHREFTEMTDELRWQSRPRILAPLVDRLVLEPHLRWYLTTKQGALKVLAESER